MPITARSTPNIALIKYWGNRSNELRIPMRDSLSMTLNSPTVEVEIDNADVMRVTSFNPDGSYRELDQKGVSRFGRHLELVKGYLKKLDAPDVIPSALSITIHSAIPPSVGFASSAAVFSALGTAISGLIANEITLDPRQISIVARLGSGSASRGAFGGYVALRSGEGNDIDCSFSEQIADEDHWTIHDIAIAPSNEEKKVGSTEGHALAPTSPHWEARVSEMPRRQEECIDALLNKDFEKLQKVSEEDCMDMHHVMQTSSPELHYLNDETYRIIEEIKELRESEHVPVLYTMDAGPTVHLFTTDEGKDRIAAYAHEQSGCTIFQTQVGRGAHLV